MHQTSLDIHMGYLIGFLEEEFSSFEGIRVYPVFPSTGIRSPDLPQDYDPETSDLHSKSGVRVLTQNGREYFFPKNWVTSSRFDLIHAAVEEIRSAAS